MAITAGDTLILTRATRTTPHLWVLLWGPAGPARAFLAVYLTTLRSHSDRTCVLQPGGHPFIQHETAVAYGEAARMTEEKLDELIGARAAIPRQPVDSALLERLRRGLLASPRTPHAIRDMAREQFGAAEPK